MIKPYYKEDHEETVVEVERYGVIHLNELPLRINLEQPGRFEIGWARERRNGELLHVLGEMGGTSMFDDGFAHLGVINKIR